MVPETHSRRDPPVARMWRQARRYASDSVPTFNGTPDSSFAERLIDGAVRGTPLAHAGTPNRAVRGNCAIAMAAGNVTVTPDEEVLARGAVVTKN